MVICANRADAVQPVEGVGTAARLPAVAAHISRRTLQRLRPDQIHARNTDVETEGVTDMYLVCCNQIIG